MAEEAPLYKIKSTLLPSLNIDYTLLGYKSPAKKDLFEYEIDLLSRYQERISAINSIKSLQTMKNNVKSPADRRSVNEEFQKAFQQTRIKNEELSKKIQSSDARIAKIQQLMKMCPGIKDSNEATFYLESNNFDVEKAKNFYTSCTGKSNVARSNLFHIRFKLPGNVEFSQNFEGNQLMWSMLEHIHKNLQKKSNFKVRIHNTKKEITFEEMTRRTFESYGLTSSTTLIIEYS